MRAIKYVSELIPLEEFSNKLGMKVTKITLGEDTIKCHVGEMTLVYLRCSDIKRIFKVKENLIDANSLTASKKGLSYYVEKEIFKGDLTKWKKNIKKLAKEISRS